MASHEIAMFHIKAASSETMKLYTDAAEERFALPAIVDDVAGKTEEIVSKKFLAAEREIGAGECGTDLCVPCDVTIPPGETVAVDLGVKAVCSRWRQPKFIEKVFIFVTVVVLMSAPQLLDQQFSSEWYYALWKLLAWFASSILWMMVANGGSNITRNLLGLAAASLLCDWYFDELYAFAVLTLVAAILAVPVMAVTPSTGFRLMPRSSLHKRGLQQANGIGLIDPGYRGNLIIPLRNVKCDSVTLKRGTFVAQITGGEDTIAAAAIYSGMPKNMPDAFSAVKKTKRGDGGFGSSEKNC